MTTVCIIFSDQTVQEAWTGKSAKLLAKICMLSFESLLEIQNTIK